MTLRRILLVMPLAAAFACNGDDGRPSLTVFAAASLTDAFEEIGDAFDDAEVTFSFGASSALREQILAGAPADVFASANTTNMEQLVDEGAASDVSTFATNALQIAVPDGNPARITGLVDFDDRDLLLGLCAEEVPCGDLARAALERAGVDLALDTSEPDVRSLLTKIEAGELDAGIVYVTDVLAAGGGVDGIAIPDAQNVVATYPIAALDGTGEADLADAFVDFVLSEEGQRILETFGFGPP